MASPSGAFPREHFREADSANLGFIASSDGGRTILGRRLGWKHEGNGFTEQMGAISPVELVSALVGDGLEEPERPISYV